MGRKIIKKGWLYEYEETAEKQLTNGYEVTRVRYVLTTQSYYKKVKCGRIW